MVQRTGYVDGEPCWADVSAPDLAASRDFYRAIFGWEYVDAGAEFGHYTNAHLGGRRVAALSPPPPDGQGVPASWSLYLATADADALAARIGQLGGKVLMGPMDIPGSGRMLVGLDPADAAFGAWQAGGHIGFDLYNEPGSMCWADLVTREPAAADSFYRGLFGYRQEQIGDGAAFDYTAWSLGDRPVCGRMRMGDDLPDVPPHWLVYFAVDDADALAARVTRAGGTVNNGPFDSPYGRIVVASDPFGAVFSAVDQSRRSAQ